VVFAGDDHEVPLNATKSPPALTARQNEAEVHETASSGGAVGTLLVRTHEVPLNFAAVPSRLTARQNVAEVQDTPVGSLRPVEIAPDQDPWLLVNASPLLLTAMQFPGDQHDTAVSVPEGTSTVPSADQTGDDHTQAFPAKETATQVDELLHETSVMVLDASRTLPSFHTVPSQTKALPRSSTAAHEALVGQEIAVRLLVSPTAPIPDHSVPFHE